MEKTTTHKVLFVSNDEVYIKAMQVILNLVFASEVYSCTYKNIWIKSTMIDHKQDFILFDISSFDQSSHEYFAEVMATSPNAILVAIIKENNEEQETINAEYFQHFILRDKFSNGFSKLFDRKALENDGKSEKVEEHVQKGWFAQLFSKKIKRKEISPV